MSAPAPSLPSYPAIDDPARPRWHFGPPAQWMNDPNGTFWHDGWYHLFYQHNPGGEEWADIHWGHGRSRNLVDWEHLPLALVPRRELGEHHCYSGCAAIDAGGTPRLLYTSVTDPKEPARQVIASPEDGALVRWTQDVASPVLDLATHDGPAFGHDWRDPYVFRAEGRTFMVLGAALGDEAVVALYENPDGWLRRWTYRAIIHRAPKSETLFFECPNFFPLGGKWVLLASPVREVEWWSGTFDLATFTFRAERHGRVDQSDAYYATQTFLHPAGRTVLVAWAQRFPKGRRWNGRVAIPRRVWLDADGFLCAEPIEELAALRGLPCEYPPSSLQAPRSLTLPGDHLHEVDLTLSRATDATIRLEHAGVVIAIGPDGVRFNDRPPVPLAPSPATRVRWLFDRSLLEIFVDGRATYTRVVPFPSAPTVQVSATGSAHLISARAWPLRPALQTR